MAYRATHHGHPLFPRAHRGSTHVGVATRKHHCLLGYTPSKSRKAAPIVSNSAGVFIGGLLLVIGIFGLLQGWRKLSAAHDKIIADFRRINSERPEADLDSDREFLDDQLTEKGWVVALGLSLILVICGGGLLLAGLT